MPLASTGAQTEAQIEAQFPLDTTVHGQVAVLGAQADASQNSAVQLTVSVKLRHYPNESSLDFGAIKRLLLSLSYGATGRIISSPGSRWNVDPRLPYPPVA